MGSTAAPIATGWSDQVAGWELHPLKNNTWRGAQQRLTLRQESSGREDLKCETFHRDPAGNQPRRAELGQQPEAGLARGRVTVTAKSSQRDQKPCD
jgi:hypothetical protein